MTHTLAMIKVFSNIKQIYENFIMNESVTSDDVKFIVLLTVLIGYILFFLLKPVVQVIYKRYFATGAPRKEKEEKRREPTENGKEKNERERIRKVSLDIFR